MSLSRKVAIMHPLQRQWRQMMQTRHKVQHVAKEYRYHLLGWTFDQLVRWIETQATPDFKSCADSLFLGNELAEVLRQRQRTAPPGPVLSSLDLLYFTAFICKDDEEEEDDDDDDDDKTAETYLSLDDDDDDDDYDYESAFLQAGQHETSILRRDDNMHSVSGTFFRRTNEQTRATSVSGP